ncbi:hypothetical protein PV726_32705 [Streptomyces europaeiscabiei]|uniref:hypothetical protein n=1 Tax=Streptomyces europaeiscabiei TaxID=146819 RepID=UPI0029B53DAE|nr:hypothetical protein [Streptomyces europaeiscabiei]MDX3695017.1 hypothetical protein [Streptomyces europaeiscabiei]
MPRRVLAGPVVQQVDESRPGAKTGEHAAGLGAHDVLGNEAGPQAATGPDREQDLALGSRAGPGRARLGEPPPPGLGKETGRGHSRIGPPIAGGR